MSLPFNGLEAPGKNHATSGGTLDTPVPSICLQDTPDSQASTESRDDYGFWDIQKILRDVASTDL